MTGSVLGFNFSAEFFALFLVFSRVGAMFLSLPGIGETSVKPRFRLVFALFVTLIIAPSAMLDPPQLPTNPWALLGLMVSENLIGLFLGIVIRLTMFVLAVVGDIMAMTTAMAFAQTSNPLMSQSGSIAGVILSTIGLLMIFALNLHHLFLEALIGSYTIFPVGTWLMMADSVEMVIRMVSQGFSLGVQLAAPFLGLSLIVNISLGVIGRVMPQFQIFFISVPASILLGMMVFAGSLGVILEIWAVRVEDTTMFFIR